MEIGPKESCVRPSIFAAGLVLAVLSGAPFASAAPAAAGPTATGHFPGDPWERSNRIGFQTELALDKVLLGPITKVHKFLTPGPVGKGLHNFVVNLQEPLVVANDLVQLRPLRAAKAAIRFLFNSTFGIAGLIDIAVKAGVPHHKSSFGDTMARYGVGPGPYLFLPMIGPSSVRDLIGNVVDGLVNPVYLADYPYRTEAAIALPIMGGLDQRLQSGDDLKALLDNAADPYATLRSTYLQNREGEINGDKPVLNALPELDDPGAAPASPSAAPQTETPAPAPSVHPSSQADAAATIADQPPALGGLPDDQGGHADGEVPRAFDQG
jgi:phospholipid-binding lipoprotein MlaA